jgi:hypothetical protein
MNTILKNILIGIVLISLHANAQFKPVELTGKIGKYSIEMFITQFDKSTTQFKGSYNYKGKKGALQIKGELKVDCMSIEEFFKNKNTGSFYLSKEDGDSLKGFWKAENKDPLTVLLKYKNAETAKQLAPHDLMTLNKSTSNDIDGTYKVEQYFISDLFHPNIDLVFNGGTANFKKLGNDSLQFLVEMVCGPTSHIAYASGKAVKKGNLYLYKANISGEDDKWCEITFTFRNKKVIAVANASFDCGFGARAYLDNELIKVDNKPSFKNE